MEIPDLSKAELAPVELTIGGTKYKIPGNKLDELEPIFENMADEDLETEIKKIAIIDTIENDTN